MNIITMEKRTFVLLLAFFILLLPAASLAAVSVGANTDQKNVQAGDTVDVTVTVKGKGMTIAEGIFTYDPAILTYLESEGGASDGFLTMVSAQKGGSDVLSARIRFTAAGAGKANVEFSIEKVLGYDGKEQQGAKSSISIDVSAPAPTPTPKPIDYAKKGVLAQNVRDASENMYVWRTLENVTVPSRYSEITLDYHGETVAAAKVEDSDAPTLLYLSNAAGDVGGYYVFDAAADKLYPYQTVSSVSKSYILLEPSGNVPLPEGFTQTTLTIDEKNYMAWKSQDAQGEVYLLYARNPDGEVGYYVYNADDGALQRYAVMPPRPAQPSLPSETQPTLAPGAPVTPVPVAEKAGQITLSSTVFYVICGIGTLALLAAVGMFIIRSIDNARRKRRAALRRAEREKAQTQTLDE